MMRRKRHGQGSERAMTNRVGDTGRDNRTGDPEAQEGRLLSRLGGKTTHERDGTNGGDPRDLAKTKKNQEDDNECLRAGHLPKREMLKIR